MTETVNPQDLMTLALAAGKPFDIATVPAVLVPEGAKLQTLEHLLERDHPHHITKNISVRTADEFVSYFNRFCNANSSVYVDVDNANFKGIIDSNGQDSPAHEDHIVTYHCPETEEWQQWKEKNSKWMAQAEFAEFLQDNHLQIYKPSPDEFKPDELDVVFDKLPDGARMLDIANTLEVRSNSSVVSGQNLHNGAIRIEYQDEVGGVGGAKGQYEIPVYFVLGIQLFKEGKGYLILARLKYRKEGPAVLLRYELIRPHKAHEKAVRDVINRIRDGEKEGETLIKEPISTGWIYETA